MEGRRLGLDITLTKKQQEGLDLAIKKYKRNDTHTVIGGLAGTGKSVLVQYIIKALNLTPEQYLVGSFTGKAAQRLSQVGFPQARTLHKMIYNTTKIGNNFIHKRKPVEEFTNIKLILIDEISMVPNKILKDVASLGIHTIVMGDPGQLPPVGEDNHMLDNPDIFLDEVMRQAEGNSIIRLAHMIRRGEKIKPFSDDNVIMVPKEEITLSMLNWADQVICGSNQTRNIYNHVIRESKGRFDPKPQEGDKIIITRNNWSFLDSDNTFPLVNGLIGFVTKSGEVLQTEERMGRSIGKDIKLARLNFIADFAPVSFTGVKYDVLPFVNGQASYIVDQFAKGYRAINYLDYGYAVTTHKFQGSEQPKILGVEERLRGINHQKWLYTMVTRSSDKLVLGYDKLSPIWDLSK